MESSEFTFGTLLQRWQSLEGAKFNSIIGVNKDRTFWIQQPIDNSKLPEVDGKVQEQASSLLNGTVSWLTHPITNVGKSYRAATRSYNKDSTRNTTVELSKLVEETRVWLDSDTNSDYANLTRLKNSLKTASKSVLALIETELTGQTHVTELTNEERHLRAEWYREENTKITEILKKIIKPLIKRRFNIEFESKLRELYKGCADLTTGYYPAHLVKDFMKEMYGLDFFETCSLFEEYRDAPISTRSIYLLLMEIVTKHSHQSLVHLLKSKNEQKTSDGLFQITETTTLESLLFELRDIRQVFDRENILLADCLDRINMCNDFRTRSNLTDCFNYIAQFQRVAKFHNRSNFCYKFLFPMYHPVSNSLQVMQQSHLNFKCCRCNIFENFYTHQNTNNTDTIYFLFSSYETEENIEFSDDDIDRSSCILEGCFPISSRFGDNAWSSHRDITKIDKYKNKDLHSYDLELLVNEKTMAHALEWLQELVIKKGHLFNNLTVITIVCYGNCNLNKNNSDKIKICLELLRKNKFVVKLIPTQQSPLTDLPKNPGIGANWEKTETSYPNVNVIIHSEINPSTHSVS